MRHSVPFNDLRPGACFTWKHDDNKTIYLRTPGGAIALSEKELKFVWLTAGNEKVEAWLEPIFHPLSTNAGKHNVPLNSLVIWKDHSGRVRRSLLIKSDNPMTNLSVYVDVESGRDDVPQQWQIESVHTDWEVRDATHEKPEPIRRLPASS